MTQVVLIFTFSPVQPFIIESRRSADLYSASKILADLARAAAGVFDQNVRIYPAEISDDVPNRIVALVPFDQAESLANKAKNAFFDRWHQITQQSLNKFTSQVKNLDQTFQSIWQKQTADDYFWDVYWVAASLEERSYQDAYLEADQALNAVKRTRAFTQNQEPGFKDTLSGRRQALHASSLPADKFWMDAGHKWVASKLRPNGRERLDALGVAKRFGEFSDAGIGEFNGFPSTSSVASILFLQKTVENALDQLHGYRDALVGLYPGFINLRDNPDWQLDGDLFYLDTLTDKRLKDDFGAQNVDPDKLLVARKRLNNLYESVGEKPSPYYAVFVLDGDNMGTHINNCSSPQEHQQFSSNLSEFAKKVQPIANEHNGYIIYNGGDDVLGMSPLFTVYRLVKALAEEFHNVVGGSASAGIAIFHHQSPLDETLRVARRAERLAKEVDQKAAVSVILKKRSGPHLEMTSKWVSAGSIVLDFCALLMKSSDQGAQLAGGFLYDLKTSAFALSEPDEMFESEIRRLLKRHRNKKHRDRFDAKSWAETLRVWAASLPGGVDELINWLYFAGFLAQGGVE